MKKLILSLLMIAMLTGCKAEPTPVPQNISDNTVNTGIACSDGEKTFLSFTDGLYIVEEDTDKLIMLTTEDSSVKFTDNDWVYYTNYTENTFCRIKKDGTEKETLHNEVCSTAVLYNNRIYFQEKSDGKTFSMNTDGTDKKDVTDWYYSDFILADDDIYYIGFDNTVNRCKLGDIDDAYNYDVIYNGRCESLNYYDGKLFFFENPAYFDENYGGDIVCTDLNGKSKQKISGGFYDKVKVYDGKIYFRKGEEIFEEETLCSMDLNGENVTEIADSVYDYNVVDDRIYIVYKDSSVGRIKTDGTEKTTFIYDDNKK